MGGYRKRSGRSKSGYYKGIYCGSTYELCWVIHSLDHNIGFSRFPGVLEQNGKKYYPDFLLDDGNTIIETKGYEKQESVDIKTQIAESLGYKVRVLRKDDLKFAFDYVREKYKVSKFQELYDSYSPKYSYICSNCKNTFERDITLKTENKFCCRRCAGLFRKQFMKQFKKVNHKFTDIANSSYKRRFSKDEALKIFNSEKSLQLLANEYNTTKNSIWFIKTKRSYKWIHSNVPID